MLIFAFAKSNIQNMKTKYSIIMLLAAVALSCGKKKPAENEQPKQDSATTTQAETKPNAPMKGTVTLTQTVFEPGEEITVNFTAEGNLGNNAWIGIIPSGIDHGNENTNDENDISYQYTGDAPKGSLVFIAPIDTGSYDFRLNSTDTDGLEVASVTFKVQGTPNTKVEINTDKKSYAKGEQMVISFKAIPGWDKNAWIGIVPANTKHGKAEDADKVDVGYVYLNGRSKGEWKFNAPTESNNYSIRIFDAEAGKEVKSIDFKVE
jgi:hypothetical protein